MIRKYIVFDLDGCLSDHEWRWKDVDHSIEDLDERYREYCEKAPDDEPMNVEIMNMVLNNCDARPLFITARHERYHGRTFDWIVKHLCPSRLFSLLMRPQADVYPPAPILKVNLISQFCQNKILQNIQAKILMAFDDRQDVIDAYNEAGISAGLLTKQAPSNEKD